MLADALAGLELRFTNVKLGDSTRDGAIVYPTREEAYEFDDLINAREFLPEGEAPFVSIDRIGGGMVSVSFMIRNANIAQGFFNREMGLFAVDAKTGVEHLYCYCNVGDACEWVPDSTSAIVYDVRMSIVTVIQEAANVTAVIDGGLAYVTQAEFTAHVNAVRPHPNAPTLGDEVTSTKYFWAQDDDINLHPISTKNARLLILGADASDIPKLDRRLTQTEINIANLYMQLNAERELGLEPNLMLVEDFADTAHLDTYAVVVTAQAAGIAEICVESDADILCGHWYTITDGINQEYRQVRSVAKNPDAVIVIFEQILNNTYNLACTLLMRTTARIIDGCATGAGDLRGKSYTFSEVWQGTGADTTVSQTLNTNQSNIDNFDLSGDYAFTADGEFTLAPMIPHVFSNSNHRAALQVTVNGTFGDFGIIGDTERDSGAVRGTEYYTSLEKITLTKENSTIIGNKNANTITTVGGENNVLTGGLNADTYIFNGGGIINGFGATALNDNTAKMYAKTTGQQGTDSYYAYDRTNPLSYSQGGDKLKVNGTITKIAYDGYGNSSTNANQSFNVTVHYTDLDGANHVIQLKNIAKPNSKKVYKTDDAVAKTLNLFDMRSGEMAQLTAAQIESLCAKN